MAILLHDGTRTARQYKCLRVRQNSAAVYDKSPALDIRSEEASNLAPKMTELTLAIPNYRVEISPTETNRAQYHNPTAWDRRVFDDLFGLLTVLEKLSVTTLVIPRSQDALFTWRYDPAKGYGRIGLPASVKHLVIEEVSDFGCVSAEAEAMFSRNSLGRTDLWDTSRTLSHFQLNATLEILHIKAPRLDIEFIDRIKECRNLKELRCDIVTTEMSDSRRWSLGIGSLLSALRKLEQLTVLDLRLCRGHDGYDHIEWRAWWPGTLPQVRTMRIAFHGFAEILQSTDCNDDIHFELLFDYNQAVLVCTSIALKTFEAKSKVAQSLIEKMDLTTEYESDLLNRISNLKDAVSTVQQLGLAYEARRQNGLVEKRRVSIVECEWVELRIGSVWFEKLDDGREFCKLVEQAIGA